MRDDRPGRPAGRAPRHRDGAAGPARAQGLHVRRARPGVAWTGTGRPTSPMRRPRRCTARRAPATSRTPTRPDGRATCSARRRSSCSSVTRSQRAISNWRFSSEHGVEERPLDQALTENLDGPAGVGPRQDVRIAVRLPGARTLHGLPRSPGSTPSRGTCTSGSSRTTSRTRCRSATCTPRWASTPTSCRRSSGERVNESTGDAPRAATRRWRAGSGSYFAESDADARAAARPSAALADPRRRLG